VSEDPRADRELVDAVLAGDQSAFRVLVDREASAVIAICHRIAGDPADAADAAQDAFVQAYKALATFRGDGAFGAWLRRIAIRVAAARMATRRDTISLDVETQQVLAIPTSGAGDPEQSTLDSEWRGDIREAVGRLPASQRDVILLRFYGDLSLQEIADLTSQPVGTVKSRIHRGIEGLRHHLPARSAP
jgi:RNA polymerase sigma-70 factor (ECF subfamily)